MKLKRLFFCPDSHIPYEDKDAFELMLRAASIFKPDTFIIGGDFADFYSVSSHNKDPSRGNDLQKEVDAVKARLDEIQKRVKPKEKVFICGNHEERLERYLMSEAPALWNSVKIPNILGLKERGWRYIPYRDHVKIGKLHVTHTSDKQENTPTTKPAMHIKVTLLSTTPTELATELQAVLEVLRTLAQCSGGLETSIELTTCTVPKPAVIGRTGLAMDTKKFQGTFIFDQHPLFQVESSSKEDW